MDFKELNFAEIDRNLSEQERQEWQAIYASCRSGSVLTGQVVGVDEHEVSYTPEGKRKAEKRLIRCLIVIPYRVKIIIPDVEVFLDFEKPPYYVAVLLCFIVDKRKNKVYNILVYFVF